VKAFVCDRSNSSKKLILKVADYVCVAVLESRIFQKFMNFKEAAYKPVNFLQFQLLKAAAFEIGSLCVQLLLKSTAYEISCF